MRIRCGVAATGILLWGALFAAPPLTTIQDVLYKADGSRFNGVAFVEWKSFQAVDFSAIATQSVTVPIQDGVILVHLVPTTNATPGAYYSVRYHSDGRIQFTETWAVPPSTTPLRLRDVRVEGSSSGGPVVPPAGATEILESDVVGLVDDLEARPLKGPGYAASRAAFITEAGTLEAVVGDLTECVRVDGTAGPCDLVTGSGPGFVDAEIPSGIVDGVNPWFTLAQVPSPPTSLALFRNGLLQRDGLDYTLDGDVIVFTTAAIPQPEDVLSASYRLADASNPVAAAGGALSGTYPNPSIAQGVISDYNISDAANISEAKLSLNHPTHSTSNDPTPDQKAALAGTAGAPSATNRYVTDQDSRLGGGGYQGPQVLCSTTGSSTSATTWTSLGSCTIPADTLAAGDRVTVSFSFTHEGAVRAPSFEIRWGGTSVISRAATTAESRIVGSAEFGLYDAGALWAAQSWGGVLSLVSGTGISNAFLFLPLEVELLGRFASSTTDTLTLRNYTVIRYPAQSIP